MKIYDAHLHFNHNSSDVINDLLNGMQAGGVQGGMLILNSADDKLAFMEHSDELKSLKTALLISPNSSVDTEFYELVKGKTGNSIIKIHPRISDISRSDFDSLLLTLEKLEFSNIIVDSFYYGHNIKNHIGIELAVYLAEAMPRKKVTVAHSGGHKILECMLYTRDMKNIFYDLSLTCCYFENTSVEKDLLHFIRYNSSRTMFGSDYPDFSFEKSVSKCLSVCEAAGCTSKETEKIMGGNYCEIYGT